MKIFIKKGKFLKSGEFKLTDKDFEELLSDGRNMEIAARMICNKEDWVLTKDPDMPTRKCVFIDGEKYFCRTKTAKGFDLAPSKMKGTQRKRNKSDSKMFASENNFLLIDSTKPGIIKYKLIKNPKTDIIQSI